MAVSRSLTNFSFSSVLIILLILLVFGVLYKLKCQPFRKYLPNIPIVKEQNWIWGLAMVMMPIDGRLDSHARLHHLVEKYGSIFQFYVLWHHVVYISDGKVAKFVYDNAKEKGTIHRASKKPQVRNLLNMLTADDEWKKRRHSFRHAFTQATLKNYSDTMSSQIVKLTNKLESLADKPEPVKIDAIFSRFALDAIFKVGFEMDYDFLENEIIFEKINDAIQQFFRLIYLPNIPYFHYVRRIPFIGSMIKPIGDFNNAFAVLRKFRRDVLKHLRQKHAENSFCSESFGKLFMDYQHDPQNRMSEEDLESELMTFIIAGHETTAHTLGWFIYSLCKYAHVQEKCHEAASSVPIGGSTSVFHPLPDYLEATIKEAMRRFPVAARGSIRTAMQGQELDLPINDGKVIVRVPSGTCLLINMFSLHRMEQNWGADVNLFRPERWLQGALASQASYAGVGRSTDEIVFSPFSAGLRNCIGMNFALWEIRSITLNLTQRFTFSLADDQLLDEEVALQTDMLTMKIMNQLPVYIRSISSSSKSG